MSKSLKNLWDMQSLSRDEFLKHLEVKLLWTVLLVQNRRGQAALMDELKKIDKKDNVKIL